MKDIIKIFKDNDSGRYVFMCIRSEEKWYKLKYPRLDRYGNDKTHESRDVDVLGVYDSLNNLVLGTWRVNGWKKAQKELEEKGYTFVKDMPTKLVSLTQNYQRKNLDNFINELPLEELKMPHDFKVGQEFFKKASKKIMYRISRVFHDRIFIEHLNLQIKNRFGKVKNFEDQFSPNELKNLISKGQIVEIKND